MQTALIMFCDIISSTDAHLKKTKWPWIAHLSFWLKPLIYMHLLQTDHAGEPLVGSFLSPELFLGEI